jgi:anthranilate synthase/aminodeoxychorismate synthase-like glutamine amidotransferase
MILVIDNYDSFTFNLVQALRVAGADTHVVENDARLADLVALAPSHVLISPGPGTPDAAGVTLAAIQHFAGRVPLLGVCLGHQALASAFGGSVVRAERLMHGKTSPIHHEGTRLFRELPRPFEAMRYHSLLVRRDDLPADFTVDAWTDEGEIMALWHRPTGALGVQFHPESILTPEGPKLLGEFVRC